MNAVLIPTAKQEIQFDRRLPSDRERLSDAADGTANWTPIVRANLTDAEIDDFIEQLANSGHYDDEFGNPVAAAPIYKALAEDWCDDPMKLPGYTYTAFLNWATARAKLAKWGK